MKKICYVTTVPGTLELFVKKSAEYLHQTGEFDITFISNPNPTFQKELPPYIHYIPVQMKRGIAFEAFRAIRQMKKIFRREGFDMVQYSTPNASFYASVAARRAKIPVRLYAQWGMAYVGFSGVKRKIFKAIEKRVCSLSTWIEPDSRSNLDFAHAEKLYPESKGSVVWNGSAIGIDFDKFDIGRKSEYRREKRAELGIDPDAFVFGFVGRLVKDKGVNELLWATKKIMDENEKAHLVIVGKKSGGNDLENELFTWATGCDRVHFTGYTTVTEQYYSAMDCYILPSYREGFGMTVIEAESIKLPVIVTDIPGPTNGMIKDETGLVVNPKDRDALYGAMTELMTSPEKCGRFAENGRKFVEDNFDQRILLEKICEDKRRLLKI